MARSSLGEDWPLKCTMKPDEGTFELADDALTIALRVRWSVSGRTSERT